MCLSLVDLQDMCLVDLPDMCDCVLFIYKCTCSCFVLLCLVDLPDVLECVLFMYRLVDLHVLADYQACELVSR